MNGTRSSYGESRARERKRELGTDSILVYLMNYAFFFVFSIGLFGTERIEGYDRETWSDTRYLYPLFSLFY